MQCPKCGRENPKHPRPCTLCGYDPTVPYEPPPQRTSTAAIASLVLAVLSFFTFIITAVPAIILACKALVLIKRSPDHLRGKQLAVTAIVLAVLAILIVPAGLYSLWSVDAPPIPNDYTLGDLRSAPTDCADSFDLLLTICPDNAHPDRLGVVGLTEDDAQVIEQFQRVLQRENELEISQALLENAETLDMAWSKTKQPRHVVARLAAYDQIADLTEPGGDFLAPMNLVDLARLHHVYIYLQLNRDTTQVPITELAELHSAVRKLAVSAREKITKVACLICLSYDTMGANAILNHPQIPLESVQLLAESFVPLSDEVVSFRNPIILEYLIAKYVVTEQLHPANFRIPSVLKRNSTLRLCRNYWDNWLPVIETGQEKTSADFPVWPTLLRRLPPVSLYPPRQLPLVYKCYNPAGSALAQTINARFGRVSAKSTDVRIYDDLLQIVLNKRLGKPVNLKPRAYSDEYIVDVEGKKIFSPGSDGKANTKDDISLPINPEVLGWND